MPVEVRLYANLRRIAGGRSVVLPGEPATADEAIAALTSLHPDLAPLIRDEDGSIRRFVAVMVDGRDIRHLAGLETPVASRSVVDIFPPIAGGVSTHAVTERLRGLPEWLIRDYLAELGGRASGAAAVTADGWRASWTHEQATIPGAAFALTEFAITFEGEREAVAAVHAAFMAKAQRGGG